MRNSTSASKPAVPSACCGLRLRAAGCVLRERRAPPHLLHCLNMVLTEFSIRSVLGHSLFKKTWSGRVVVPIASSFDFHASNLKSKGVVC